jgi:hypothetical protein
MRYIPMPLKDTDSCTSSVLRAEKVFDCFCTIMSDTAVLSRLPPSPAVVVAVGVAVAVAVAVAVVVVTGEVGTRSTTRHMSRTSKALRRLL